MTGQRATPADAATIEVQRHRRLSEIMAIGWRVFVDGVWAGDIAQGKSVRFDVDAGHHTLKIWSHKGAYCSDEIELDLASGSVTAFECRARPLPSRMGDQVNVITSTMRNGGVTKGQILLVEVSPNQSR